MFELIFVFGPNLLYLKFGGSVKKKFEREERRFWDPCEAFYKIFITISQRIGLIKFYEKKL
jgi:hypothetical protein